MIENGWIKLHRQIRENLFYKHPHALAVWLECLLRASFQDNAMLLKREEVALQQGQFIMGREEFGKAIGVSGSTAWYWLLRFEADSMVDIKKTTKGSIVTVKNWHQYQVLDSEVDNKKTTKKQQKNTNKKDKKVKKDKNTIGEVVFRCETEALYDSIEKLCNKYNIVNKVNKRSLDVYVNRYIGKIKMGVQVQKCIAWLIDKNLKMLSTSRLGNWFEKALEIQERERRRQQFPDKSPWTKASDLATKQKADYPPEE